MRAASATSPAVLPGLLIPTPPALHWQQGERERWAAAWMHDDDEPRGGWRGEIERVFADTGAHRYRVAWLLAAAPVELVVPYRDVLPATDFRYSGLSILRRVLARFGDAAAPVLVEAAHRDPQDLASALLPIDGTTATFVMARLLRDYATQREALAWFARHIHTAAPDLVAAALDAPLRQRELARTALDTLGRCGHREVIHQAAADVGSVALATVTAPPLRDAAALHWSPRRYCPR
ncbi:hypothetical protein JK358_38105 [Nocardia sp. 2]|uniref:HEAT repeat domain-containing protein n=1 Tax=Nocardia acididurans TaxID=2802282 RepID=A0ABS1MHT0_9NOCA|nr:hypothetical protein [Nocardia acididurans]MBL1080225.1 hypothetical protein [Nocardia acididurans]